MIHVARNGKQEGPYPLEQVNQMLAAGQLSAGDLSWKEGMANWVPLSAMPGVVVPVYAPPGATTGYQASMYGGQQMTSGLAITSMIMGILALPFYFLFIFAILAIIFGHVAMSGIKRSAGAIKGTGMAIAGLVLGYLSLVVTIVVVVFVANTFLDPDSPFRKEFDKKMKEAQEKQRSSSPE